MSSFLYRKVIKDTSILSGGTLFSRLLGFVRDVLIARLFGTSLYLEAFIVAFRLPNIFRSIFAEGFTDSVATPLLAEYHTKKNKLFDIGNHLLSFSIVILALVTVGGIIFSKYLVLVIAPGFIHYPYKFNLTVSFVRVTFLYLFLIGLSANTISLLYALKKFFIPSINPAFLNISFIIGIVFFGRYFKSYILVICVLVAGFLQVIFPFIFLKREGFYLKFDFFSSFKDKTIIKMLKLFVPRVWSSIIYHLSVFVDTIFSSLTQIVGEGALAAIYYSNRLIQFPLAIIALSISRVAMVDLSSYEASGNLNDFKKLFVFSFQNIIFFVIPISIMFVFIPREIIDVVFRRGEFGLSSLKITANAFFFYSWGLFFFCAIKLLVNSFYSLKDTITPAKTATISLVINIVLSAILIFPLKIGGVALGSSIAAMVNFFLLYVAFVKKIGRINWEDTKLQFIRVVSISLIVGLVSRFLWDNLIFSRYLKMLIILGSNLVIFILGGDILGIRQINYLKRWVFLNLKKKS
jgi:putative peptidoglycan lipid II flippase